MSVMPELCQLLNITINELLSGERISMEEYKNKAEANLLELQRQEELNNRKLLSLEIVIGCISTLAFLVMVFTACLAVELLWWRIALIIAGMVIFIVGIVYALKLEQEAGYYECPDCHTKYVPTLRAVVLAPHFGRSRRMKCPHCGCKGYHKKRLTK